MKVLDFLLAWPLWKKYDSIQNDGIRLLLCMLLVLPPVYILNGAFHNFQWAHLKWVQITASLYLLYLLLSSTWKLMHYANRKA